MSYSWKVQVHRAWDEVDDPSFIRQWKRWMQDSADAHVFNHPALVTAWTDTYRSLQDITPLYVVAETDGFRAFLPLVLWRRNWKNAFVRVIVPAGYSDYDYHDPVVAGQGGQAVRDSFWFSIEGFLSEEIKDRYDKIMLNGVRNPGGSQNWEKDDVECPYTDMSKYRDFDEFFSSLKKKLRSDINRRKRRITELGELTYHVHKADEVQAAIQSLLPMLEAHRKRRPKAYKAPGFHEALVRYGLPESVVHFSEMKLDGRTISWRLGFLYKNRFYSYMPAFLEEYSGFSPNKVHLSFVMEDCFSRGVECFDHLRGDHRYKEEWPTDKASLFLFEQQSEKFASRSRLWLLNKLNKLKR